MLPVLRNNLWNEGLHPLGCIRLSCRAWVPVLRLDHSIAAECRVQWDSADPTIGVRASHGDHVYNYHYDDSRTAKVTAISLVSGGSSYSSFFNAPQCLRPASDPYWKEIKRQNLSFSVR